MQKVPVRAFCITFELHLASFLILQRPLGFFNDWRLDTIMFDYIFVIFLFRGTSFFGERSCWLLWQTVFGRRPHYYDSTQITTFCGEMNGWVFNQLLRKNCCHLFSMHVYVFLSKYKFKTDILGMGSSLLNEQILSIQWKMRNK